MSKTGREILPQTSRVIAQLTACGLARRDFSAQCTRRWKKGRDGRRYPEYGNVVIRIHNQRRGIELAEQLAKEFSVSLTCIDGDPRHVTVRVPGREYYKSTWLTWKSGLSIIDNETEVTTNEPTDKSKSTEHSAQSWEDDFSA